MTTDSGMAGTLRGGLSLGLSGFTFWSHDMGGFVERTPRELYSRWVPFGMLTSHIRAHGQPPKEPWEYDAAFVDEYRRAVELKYALMPYVYAQTKAAAERGHPMLRIELRIYGAGGEARGFFALPDGTLQALVAVRRGASYALKDDPLRGKVNWTFLRR